MRRFFATAALCAGVFGIVGVSAAHADLVTAFSGFNTVNEVGVSGLMSSYASDTANIAPRSGASIATSLATFGPARVSYPGVGTLPSPGGSELHNYDEGVVGVRVSGGNLIVQIASGINPLTGVYNGGWNTVYGQGDMFIAVDDGNSVNHFALLNAWARDGANAPVSIGQGTFAAAQGFHLGAGVDGGTREGNLVKLMADADIALSGGPGSYNPGNAPAGLDLRTLAQGGVDLGDANLVHNSTTDGGQTWYIQTWTVPMGLLADSVPFSISLHNSPTCSNDQIGGEFLVPEPGTLLTILMGVGAMAARRRIA